MKHWIRLLLPLCLLFVSAGGVAVQGQTTPPKISPRLSMDSAKVQKGKALRASLIFEIPGGYHVNAHNPISKFALPTRIEVKTSGGLKVGAISYPKAVVRHFGFSEDALGVYENRAVIRFVVSVPANEPGGKHELKVRLRYQSCSDQVCFPPAETEVVASFDVS